MPYFPDLKVVGWTSGYPSIQKYLNYLKKEKKIASSEEAVTSALQAIALLCEAVEENPDQIVAALKADEVDSDYYFDSGKDKLSQFGADKGTITYWEACVSIFMDENGA